MGRVFLGAQRTPPCTGCVETRPCRSCQWHPGPMISMRPIFRDGRLRHQLYLSLMCVSISFYPPWFHSPTALSLASGREFDFYDIPDVLSPETAMGCKRLSQRFVRQPWTFRPIFIHAVPVWVRPGPAVGPGHRWQWQRSWRSGWRPTVGSRQSRVP